MQICVRMRNFHFATENIADKNLVTDDADRIRMHVNTPIEINGTQKIGFTELTLLAYMCTQSKIPLLAMQHVWNDTSNSCHVELYKLGLQAKIL